MTRLIRAAAFCTKSHPQKACFFVFRRQACTAAPERARSHERAWTVGPEPCTSPSWGLWFHTGEVCPQGPPTKSFFFFVEAKMSWRSLITVWDSRQPLGIKAQSCPVLR